jgi:hypothetical protein
MQAGPSYQPALVEQYVLEHAVEFGYDKRSSGCDIWKEEASTPYYKELHMYLARYV